MEMETPGQLLATREHIIPRSEGGSDDRSNLVAACRGCNEARSNRVDAHAFARLRRKHLDAGIWVSGSRPTARSLAAMRGMELERSVAAWKDRYRATRARFQDMALGRHAMIRIT